MRWFISVLVLSAVLAPAALAEPKTLQGEIVDPAAFLKTGAHGPEQEELTYEAVDGGQTLAFLEDGSGALYLLLAEEPGEDPNELAYDYVNRKVKVVGTVFERAGVRGLVIGSITPTEPVTEPAAGSPAAAAPD